MRLIDRQIRGKLHSAFDKIRIDILKTSVRCPLCSFMVSLHFLTTQHMFINQIKREQKRDLNIKYTKYKNIHQF